MKKFIMIFVAMFTLTFATANAQRARFSGNIGVTASVEPHNDNYIAFPAQVNLGMGARFSNGIYVGGGIAPGVDVEYFHAKFPGYATTYSETETTFIMPMYVQLSYIRPYGGYFADLKFGKELVATSDDADTFFYVNITPIGYAFDEHNAIGLGWRYHHKNKFDGHAISLTYQYTF